MSGLSPEKAAEFERRAASRRREVSAENKWPQLSRPLDGATLRVISHGGGLQTSVLCLMAARGEIGPMPDMAIFADTGGELRRTYAYLDYLQEHLPFPIVRVRRPGPTLGDLMLAVARGERGRSGTSMVPFYALSDAGERSMLPKQCSKDYKTRVVAREVQRILGIDPGKRGPAEPTVEMWVGMTMDELTRVATNEKKWIHNRHPLVERGMNRRDCIRWAEERQYRVPQKSSCKFCPFRDNPSWQAMSENDPEDFAEACDWDDAMRTIPGFEGQLFIHRRFVPLRNAVLEEPTPQLPLFSDCDSCGV